MARFRIIATIVTEFEANAGFYPDAETLEEMLEIDLEAVRDEPVWLLDGLGDTTDITVTGEIIKEESNDG